jgi:hypothetical protein
LYIQTQKQKADIIINYYTNENLKVNYLDDNKLIISYNETNLDNVANIYNCYPNIKTKLIIQNKKILEKLNIVDTNVIDINSTDEIINLILTLL